MATYAVVDAAGLIVNRIELDAGSDWLPPEGHVIVAETAGPLDIGGTYINGVYAAPVSPVAPLPTPPQAVLSQDMMAQFTADDAAKIQAAVSGNAQFWLLWSAMQAQKDPMLVTNARFLAGWSALVQVLGQARMDAIAKALGVTIG